MKSIHTLFDCACIVALGLFGSANHCMATPTAPTSDTSKWISGVDLSGLPEMERMGADYTFKGQAMPMLQIVKAAEFDMVRLRLFLDADGRWGAVNDLPHTLALAKRVDAAGFPILLSVHYSDTWADPGNQHKPKAWEGLDFDSLKLKVREYTRDVVRAFQHEGIDLAVIQLGNEITPGFIWPEGQLKQADKKASWTRFTEMLQAASMGVRDAAPDGGPQRMIHIDRGGNLSTMKWFFEEFKNYEVDYELIGLSHYPFLHNTMEEVRESLTYLNNEVKVPFIIVETAHPHGPIGPDEEKHPTGYSYSPGGQYRYLRDLTHLLSEFPLARGLFYWYPEGIPTQEVPKPWYHGRNALFDSQGAALPGLLAMKHEREVIEHTVNTRAAVETESPKNILLIFPEDLGLQIGPYGDTQIPTPGLDRLAAGGTVFDNAYATSATCSPSRASLFSGQYPHQSGHLGLADYGYSIHPGTLVFPQLLKEAGYTTGLSYKIHVNPESMIRRHFDKMYSFERITKVDRTDTKDWEAHLRYFREFLGERDPAKPFYYQAQTHDTHEPFSRGRFKKAPEGPNYRTVEPGEIRPLDSFGADIPHTKWLNSTLAEYYNSIQRVDALVDGLMTILEEEGLLENTVVIFSADHGPSFARGKLSVNELGVRVPLIIRWPGDTSHTQRLEALVSLVDLAPTFCQIAGVEPPAQFVGQPLQELLFSESSAATWRSTLATEYHSHTTVDWWPMRSIRDSRYKLIENMLFGTEAANFLLRWGRVQTEGESPDKTAGLQAPEGSIARGIYTQTQSPPRYELYDLERDPGETQNLANSPEMQAVLESLKGTLNEWQVATDDPFLDASFLADFTAAQIEKQKEIRAYEVENGTGSFWGKPISKGDWSEWLKKMR
ncbi:MULTISPECIES: glycosyl hydrolase 53 family protein [unclassified Lentimonas]|uniref:glycosyl hydrolase 53 family protein n=1 Tax=unclassified Lentimonas TaxID=2630993 RepID=UPI00132198E7|nr:MULTISPECIES: glycosyl hydrolase 53 family protein [unclassified Lentimonas]CAA6679352.1 Choline-sulfatase (EC [Lentimonas sp. CC4]CAA6686982.1 Choline-sulfatase (EC [Lentimonas sp. CC6]CAA7078042.1 Choline-sulfatase (EC [Lentimonas sp. CC4]CAA7168011.1 Choline-sulfatase (EC [Lentimonas sp. CC21]CAA7179586.1 Choline-sulfatase (EC [Lentimonas sp. CC8]